MSGQAHLTSLATTSVAVATVSDDGNDTVHRQVACPLCGARDGERMFPSLKMDAVQGLFRPSPDIWIEICRQCGLVHENPQIDVARSTSYRERHYYNAYNRIATHDEQQRGLNPYRWSVLEQRLDWASTRCVIDIGASGAWSAQVKAAAGAGDVDSVLVEPSIEAIDFCRAHYPDVRAVHGPFETFEAPDASVDVISFFHSLYVIGDARGILEKCWRLLRPDGRLVIVISHVLCEIEVWSEQRRRPWLDLDHLIRGVPLVYYSRRTLAALVEAAGFEIVEGFETPYPENGALAGRHDYWVVAKPRPDLSPAPRHDKAEAAWARQVLSGYSARASERSVRAFFADGRPGAKAERLRILFDDPAYRDWVCGILAPSGRSLEPVHLDAYRSAGENRVVPEGYITLNATMTPVGGKAVDCLRPEDGNGYGYFTRTHADVPVVGRAFLPYRGVDGALFPFADFKR